MSTTASACAGASCTTTCKKGKARPQPAQETDGAEVLAAQDTTSDINTAEDVDAEELRLRVLAAKDCHEENFKGFTTEQRREKDQVNATKQRKVKSVGVPFLPIWRSMQHYKMNHPVSLQSGEPAYVERRRSGSSRGTGVVQQNYLQEEHFAAHGCFDLPLSLDATSVLSQGLEPGPSRPSTATDENIADLVAWVLNRKNNSSSGGTSASSVSPCTSAALNLELSKSWVAKMKKVRRRLKKEFREDRLADITENLQQLKLEMIGTAGSSAVKPKNDEADKLEAPAPVVRASVQHDENKNCSPFYLRQCLQMMKKHEDQHSVLARSLQQGRTVEGVKQAQQLAQLCDFSRQQSTETTAGATSREEENFCYTTTGEDVDHDVLWACAPPDNSSAAQHPDHDVLATGRAARMLSPSPPPDSAPGSACVDHCMQLSSCSSPGFSGRALLRQDDDTTSEKYTRVLAVEKLLCAEPWEDHHDEQRKSSLYLPDAKGDEAEMDQDINTTSSPSAGGNSTPHARLIQGQPGHFLWGEVERVDSGSSEADEDSTDEEVHPLHGFF
ncbi:unnamed protein product [Amoebophrya sp. A120]|nr:unnamed protein product [Amoebophrya sp. A120]|eukprot:GSA120T00026028001.1